MMEITILERERIEDFIHFCRKHRDQVDDSYIYEEDLNEFELNEENPTYIICDGNGKIVAAASLIITDYFKRGRKARFRIFHSEIEELVYYEALLKAVLKDIQELDAVFLFIPLANGPAREFMEKMNFTIERYAFVLVRDGVNIPGYTIPDGYELRLFRPGQDENIWCEVRNAGFAQLKGSETPMTQQMAADMLTSSDYIEGGLKILYHGSKPVGVLRATMDEYEGEAVMSIGPVALIPEYQGKGLGRILVRAGLQFACEKSYGKTILSVNGDNERAKALYIQEGFKQVAGLVCYVYELG